MKLYRVKTRGVQSPFDESYVIAAGVGEACLAVEDFLVKLGVLSKDYSGGSDLDSIELIASVRQTYATVPYLIGAEALLGEGGRNA